MKKVSFGWFSGKLTPFDLLSSGFNDFTTRATEITSAP